MYQVAAELWNQIAPFAKSEWARKVFALDQLNLNQYLELQADKLMEKYDPSVVVAYQELAPLLLEHSAISQFLSSTQHAHLLGALPEMLTPEECLRAARRDHGLNVQQSASLLILLRALIPSPTSDRTAAATAQGREMSGSNRVAEMLRCALETGAGERRVTSSEPEAPPNPFRDKASPKR